MRASSGATDEVDLCIEARAPTMRDVDVSPAHSSSHPAIAFFCPDVTESSTLKRVEQFMAAGFDVTVYGFRRARYNTGFRPTWPHVPLGFTADARYGQRLGALLRALPALIAHRRQLSTARLFHARNIDQLLLVLFCRTLLVRRRVPVVYEVLDIAPILAGRGLRSMLLRAIERLCLRHVSLLVLSSPGFHRNYFAPVQGYRSAWFLLENKLFPSPPPPPRHGKRPPGSPWVIGYFGLIRGEATVELIRRLATRLGSRVRFRFAGVLTTVAQARFDALLRDCPNIEYCGPYLPQKDLERLYREVDFAWALDLEHTEHNSRWLMPCRFYEAGFHGVPCLAVRDFEVGRAIDRRGIGWTFEAPLEESLAGFFERLTLEEYDRVRARLATMPCNAFVARDDVDELCRALADLAA